MYARKRRVFECLHFSSSLFPIINRSAQRKTCHYPICLFFFLNPSFEFEFEFTSVFDPAARRASSDATSPVTRLASGARCTSDTAPWWVRTAARSTAGRETVSVHSYPHPHSHNTQRCYVKPQLVCSVSKAFEASRHQQKNLFRPVTRPTRP